MWGLLTEQKLEKHRHEWEKHRQDSKQEKSWQELDKQELDEKESGNWEKEGVYAVWARVWQVYCGSICSFVYELSSSSSERLSFCLHKNFGVSMNLTWWALWFGCK